ncbi:MAG: hypothetical protein ACKO92_05560 [Actinomycetota bacterium]
MFLNLVAIAMLFAAPIVHAAPTVLAAVAAHAVPTVHAAPTLSQCALRMPFDSTADATVVDDFRAQFATDAPAIAASNIRCAKVLRCSAPAMEW